MVHESIKGVSPDTRRLDGWDDVEVSDGDEAEFITIARYSLLTIDGDWVIWLTPKRDDDPETVESTGFLYPPSEWRVRVSAPGSTWGTKVGGIMTARAEVEELISEIREGCVRGERSFMSS